MSADTLAMRPYGRFKETNIHSKYLLVADLVPPAVAAEVVSGRSFVAGLVHGYIPEIIGFRRYTQVTVPGGDVFYETREPSQEVLLGSQNPPYGVSADTERKEKIGPTAFTAAWDQTLGYRVGKERHRIEYKTAPGCPLYPATIEVFRAGQVGEVAGLEEVDGHLIVVVRFTNIGEAQEFNEPGVRPPWFGDVITKPFSAKKLVMQLAGKDKKKLAPGLLKKSATLSELEERATQV